MFAFRGCHLSRFLARFAKPLACWTGCLLILSLLFVGPPSATPPSGAKDKGAGNAEAARHSKEQIRPRVPMLGHTDAWKRLPQVEQGGGQNLPSWARVLAATLPHTTAAMLELDFRNRTRSPLGPKLRGQLRWVAAHTNGCRYSEAYAAADLRRAGMDDAAIGQLAGDLRTLPDDTRMVVQFARKLTRDGRSVTDDEVTHLVARYGERQVVAMVLLLAYASFQDRLILALDLPLGSDEPLPPVDVRFVPRPLCASRASPPRKSPQGVAAGASVSRPADTDWPKLDFEDIQKQMAAQRDHRCRISVPGDNPDAPRWGLVCRAYQPELANAWSACVHAFGDEANQDPIFEQSVFWIVTRTVRCFY